MSVTSTTRVIESGRERLRLGPWRGDPAIAYLNPVPGAALPSVEFILRCVDDLENQGYSRVVTGALSPTEQGSFRTAGFVVTEHLHLLSHDLAVLPPVPAVDRLRRGGRHHRLTVLELDSLAFDDFWRLDDAGLDEAMAATPHTRFRVASSGDGTPVIGYAITGRSGRRGYLQRLAVHPAVQGQGLGALFVADALGWLRRWRVERAMVNTQFANRSALRLYERMGFRREPSGLSVLARNLR